MTPQATAWLDPAQVHLERRGWGRLTATIGGRRFSSVGARRAFPLSAPEEAIALFCAGSDEDEGESIGLIADGRALAPGSWAALCACLAEGEGRPRILEVRRIHAHRGLSRWSVATDRGSLTFDLAAEEAAVRVLEDGRALLTDTRGHRYELPPLASLPAASRRQVERFAPVSLLPSGHA